MAYPLSEDGLTNELVDFFHYTELTSHETAARARLLRCVEASVQEMWSASASDEKPMGKTAQVSLYGSFALGLSLPRSDIDLVLSFPAEERQEAEERRLRALMGKAEDTPDALEAARGRQQRSLERLHDLAEHLRRTHAQSLVVEVYDQCRVPRIHLRDTAADGVSCDINSSLTSERVARVVARQQRWLKNVPLAAFLVRVTKAAVRQWDLNEVFAGGLASTALYCLVLRFLAQAEQLHRHANSEGKNLSPPRYEEATQSVSSSPLSTSTCCSPLTPSSHTTSSVSFVSPTAAPTTSAVENGSLSASETAAATPIASYVPSWVVVSNKSAAAVALLSKVTKGEKENAKPTDGIPTMSGHGCSPDQSHSNSGCHKETEEDDSDDSEVDALTQEALTGSSCATTAATTPTSRSATITPPLSLSSCSSGAVSRAPTSPVAASFLTFGAAVQKYGAWADTPEKTLMTHTTTHDDFPLAEELTRMAQARYGASPARLLLRLWRALSADTFLSGYQVADVFGDDATWATCELEAFSGKPSALPGTAALELATYASRRNTDLSAPSFRLPDLLALFRCSSASLDNMLRFQRYPRRAAPTMLSTIFVDPRAPL
ncbi:unspecified product [Leptomonas pyrrhocoris]|uniref:Unspecified product n=1 Tax=Leptomonas pyrrhocoris TaxID=157538 RepID=A0A0M9G338_LEPPY|nr:unspecified product [Leptomonas pyrrhocoris]KPA81430.1 unspecified product [Leptomonas pyrrhocoris]|eukprot:XP_015659869.1 unspecified product [Leptomonas pyrrhocoris]